VELIAAELCTDCVLMGDWQAAIPFARQALAHRRYTSLPLVMLARWPETAALLRSGDITPADEDARRWGELAGHLPRFRVPHLRSLALLAEWREERRQAITHLEEAVALAEEIGLPGEQWQILAVLAGLYERNGDKEKARQAVSRAVELIQFLAAKIQDAELRASFLMAGSLRQILGKYTVN
jgi:tetratricopeptide (TPR) repeat protein